MNTGHDIAEHLGSVDLNLLVALDVLLETRSVTRTAQRLGVTQSAMSHSLRRLRETLHDPLLVRSGGGMDLTPRAEALAVPLRAALIGLARTLAEPVEFEPAAARRAYSLASPDLFDALLLPAVLDRLRAQAPYVDLAIQPVPDRALADALRTGELDLAIVPVPEGAPAGGSNELVRRTLFHDEFCCFVRSAHPALQNGELELRAFLDAAHAMVSPSGRGLGVVDAALAERGLQRRIAVRLPTFAAAPRIIARSDLILTGPASMDRLLDGLQVVSVPPPIPLPGHRVAMQWHGRFTADPGHRWLRELIADAAAGLGPTYR